MNKGVIRIVAKDTLPIILKHIADNAGPFISDKGLDDNIEHFGKIHGEQYSIGYNFIKGKDKILYKISYRLFLAVEDNQ